MSLRELNESQKRAVMAGDGPVVIIAGPGTGKTKTLTARIAHLITSGRARPAQILALTFTKKAAEEMKARLLAGLEGQSAAHISTFHALCHELLGNDVTYASDPVRLQIIKKLTRPVRLKGLSARELGLLISRAKNMAEDDPEIAQLVTAYDEDLHQQGLIDFDDLLVRTRQLLLQDAQKRTELQARYTHILVDEFQDTNTLQYELLQLLRGNDNLFVIGDPEQSIYGFRGASGDIFDKFKADFPQHRDITLTINYRSVPEVVQASNAIFTSRTPLEAYSQTHGSVQAIQVLNEYAEAAWVCTEIQRAIGGGDMLRAISDDDPSAHVTLKDFAILYRNRAVALATQRAIRESGLPYQIVGEGSPYEQPKVQALIALLRSTVTGELPELEGFSSSEINLVHDKLADASGAAPSALTELLMQVLGFEGDPALKQFVGSLVRFPDVVSAVAYLDRLSDQDFYDANADAITLSTIHASKGLEFAHVFLIGAEQGVLPHSKADRDEEKRLFYVAATRPKTHLDILYTTHRGGQPSELSAFVRELPDEVLPKVVDPHLADDQRRLKKRQLKKSQQSLF